MAELTSGRSSIAQTAIVSVATFAALALLGVVLAYWTWAWLAPRPEPRTATLPELRATASSAYGLFGNASRSGNVAASTADGVRLLGVVAAERGRQGYAVVQLASREVLAVREGEDIAAGIRLAEVHNDHVILLRNGIRESLAWPDKK
jgi:general secretion pathway protein C